MDTPELWQFTSSHFNEKARWALDFKHVPHIRHSLIPGFHVPVVKRMTGKTHRPRAEVERHRDFGLEQNYRRARACVSRTRALFRRP